MRQLILRGGNAAFWDARDKEILVEGPRGTGKTRTILELLNQLCHAFPGLIVIVARKYQKTLASTCIRTFEEQVKKVGDGVSFFGGNDTEPACYRYPNGSKIIPRGMDDPEKVKSSEADIVYVNEATELSEDEWESWLPSLRHVGPGGQPIIQHRRLIGDCNPAHDKHWLVKRRNEGRLRWIKTTIRDNPLYTNADGSFTPDGEAYMDTLTGLSGIRRQQWIDGEWVGMENAIYPQLDRAKHLTLLPERVSWGAGAIGVDRGDEHPNAVVAVQRDSLSGVWWVRECWCEAGSNRQDVKFRVRAMRTRFRINRGRVDPNQSWMGDELGFKVAKKGPGTRKQRIDMVAAWLDAGALMFDLNGEGVEALVDEMQTYRWEKRETLTFAELVPVRIDDDRVAALEYAVEELMADERYEVPGAISVQRGHRRSAVTLKKARV